MAFSSGCQRPSRPESRSSGGGCEPKLVSQPHLDKNKDRRRRKRCQQCFLVSKTCHSWPGLGLVLLLAFCQWVNPVRGLIPEFLSYKTCADSPPAFSGCMTNVTVDVGEKVVLNCQVDPRCSIWYLRWYHEPDIGFGERLLLKTSRNANDPYVHTIHKVSHHDFGKYTCVMENVVGTSECTAHVARRSAAPPSMSSLALTWVILALSQWWTQLVQK